LSEIEIEAHRHGFKKFPHWPRNLGSQFGSKSIMAMRSEPTTTVHLDNLSLRASPEKWTRNQPLREFCATDFTESLTMRRRRRPQMNVGEAGLKNAMRRSFDEMYGEEELRRCEKKGTTELY
jgi:hypothetical protein